MRTSTARSKHANLGASSNMQQLQTPCSFLAVVLAAYLICLWLLWAAFDMQIVLPSTCGRQTYSIAAITMGLFGYVRFLSMFFLSTPKPANTANVSLPSYPLAVKSPYLSTWLPNSEASDVANGQPQFWAGQNINWPVLGRVDGTTYALLNAPDDLPSNIQKAATDSVSYTSTHTVIKLVAGDATFTLDFFSPVFPEAKDYGLQSLPYSYLTVNASALSGASNVQLFAAIDHTWSGQGEASCVNLTTINDTKFFWFYSLAQIPYTESNDQATYGSVLFGSTNDNLTYDCDTSSRVLSKFADGGALSTSAVNCSGSDLVGLAKDLDVVGPTSVGATFAIGLQRDLTVQYLSEAQTGYHRTKWFDIPAAIEYFLSNYEAANLYSRKLDRVIRAGGESVSSNFGSKYADILEASVRQSFASLELTVPLDDLSAEPSAFLKEISSDGNVNTVDLIFQSWPIFISLNPEWIKLQLKPILSYLASGKWPLEYAIHDIGTHYPNATGHDDGKEEHMPLFETSGIFILLAAYQTFSGDVKFSREYESLFRDWAEYLTENSLYPASQLISVDAIPASANQTGLAIQSAIGLQAAALLSENLSYSEIATSYMMTLYYDSLGLDGNTLNESTHFTYNYGETETWNVLFAAYSDVVLNLTTFPQAAWDLQSSWYLQQIQDHGLAFAGPQSDRGVNWALTDWNMMWAAVAGRGSSGDGQTLQEKIITTTWKFMTNGLNNIPFGTKYYVEGDEAGVWIGNKARGTVGTHFALLVLQKGQLRI